MATYLELDDLARGADNNDLLRKVAVAVTVKAQGLLAGATPTATEVAWASSTLRAPQARARQVLYYVLAANKDLSVAQITGAADSAIQTHVDTAADAQIAGGVTE